MTETYYVHGIPAGSKEEYWFGQALDHYSLSFDFQVPVFGGRNRAGGQVVDFVVYEGKIPQPVFINGAYWHQDKTKNLMAQKAISKRMRGAWREPLIIWDYELPNADAAMKIVRKVWVT